MDSNQILDIDNVDHPTSPSKKTIFRFYNYIKSNNFLEKYGNAAGIGTFKFIYNQNEKIDFHPWMRISCKNVSMDLREDNYNIAMQYEDNDSKKDYKLKYIFFPDSKIDFVKSLGLKCDIIGYINNDKMICWGVEYLLNQNVKTITLDISETFSLKLTREYTPKSKNRLESSKSNISPHTPNIKVVSKPSKPKKTPYPLSNIMSEESTSPSIFEKEQEVVESKNNPSNPPKPKKEIVNKVLFPEMKEKTTSKAKETKPKIKELQKSNKPCLFHMRGKCRFGDKCRDNHELGKITCKYLHKCTNKNCKFGHNVWEQKYNCVLISFDPSEDKNAIEFKLSFLEDKFKSKSFKSKDNLNEKNTPKYSFSLSSDKQASDFKSYFDNTVEANNLKRNNCEIISRTKFFEIVGENGDNSSTQENIDIKDCFVLLILKNGSSIKDFSSSLEKLRQFDSFVKIVEAEKKGRKKGWTKILFSKMTPQIASIFYNSKEKSRHHHPKFNNCQVKLADYNIVCSQCKMVGHEFQHCCEGLKYFVDEHGPNLCSKFTHSRISKLYDVNTYKKAKNNFFVRNTTNNKTAEFRWKDSTKKTKSEPVPEQNKYSSTKKSDVKSKTLKNFYSALEEKRNIDVSIHLSDFCEKIKQNDEMIKMGSENWKSLFDRHFSDLKKSFIVTDNTKVDNLEIHTLISSNLSRIKNFNLQGDTTEWITKIFILSHSNFLKSYYENITKMTQMKLDEMIKRKIQTNDKETFSFLNSMNRTCQSKFRLILGSNENKNLGINDKDTTNNIINDKK